jgi:nicotinate-nucleotide adenylyltransferase
VTSVTGAPPGRLGVLGGTFDPPHIGHLLAALSVREQLDLHEVWLIPAGDPWQKRGTRAITPAAIRLEMVAAAVADLPGLQASDLEVRRSGPSYTIDTLDALRAECPGREVVLILGRDAAAGLPTWHRHEEVLARCTVAVLDREGAPPLDDAVAGATVEMIAMRRIDVSSTELRARVQHGRSIDVLVPPAVTAVIGAHRLYRELPT